jgi:hypothetical protein
MGSGAGRTETTDIRAMPLGVGRTDHAPHNAQPHRLLAVSSIAGYRALP